MGRGRPTKFQSKHGVAIKICSHTPKAAPPCQWASCTCGGFAIWPASSLRWRRCTAERHCWCASTPITAACIFAPRQPRRVIRRWPPMASCSTWPFNGPWRPDRRCWAHTRQLAAGELPLETNEPWKQLAGSPTCLVGRISLPRRRIPGRRADARRQPYRRGRPRAGVGRRSSDRIISRARFRSGRCRRGGTASLVHEIWRLFLCAMIVAMLFEASLCLPKRRTPGASSW